MSEIRLCDIYSCTQCQACKGICPRQCIEMVNTKDGFYLPVINDEQCIECGACMRACHKISPKLPYNYPLNCFACWTKIEKDRRNSSSGGAFSVFAKKILNDGGIVYGASMDSNLQVKHISIESDNELIKLQGSKYIQSDLPDTYSRVKDHLQSGRIVLFSGTPCQVAGLHTFLKKIYENLYTIDVICHGVPSQEAFNIYTERIGINGKYENFNFRFTEGWGYQLSKQKVAPTYAKPSKKIIIGPKDAYYLRAFTEGLMFAEACYTCPYAQIERVSDITLADYWGLGDLVPFDHPTSKGVSCLLVNTSKGENLVANCTDLEIFSRPLEEAIKGNHNLTHTSNRPKGRDSYFNDSISMPIDKLCARYNIEASLRDYLRILKQLFFSL